MKAMLVLLLFIVFNLSAATNCNQSTSSHVEYMQCLDQQLDDKKRELTSWENNHLFKLEEQASTTGRQDVLKLFNKSRQTFSLYTEQDCRWQFLSLLPDSQAASMLFKQCQLRHLNQRIELLKQINASAE